MRLLLSLFVATTIAAQHEPPAGPPRIRSVRYDEDYSYLRDEARATSSWWEALKYVPHGDGDVHLTLGAELRVRYEAYANDAWGGAPQPDHDYTWLRALPCADLRIGERFRAFAQLVSAFEIDDEAGTSPLDEDRADLLQAFADVTLTAGEGTVTLRGGRQLLAYGSERLISTRYGPNVLQAFDVAKVSFTEGRQRLDLFGGRPVDHEPGSFDDATSDDVALWSAYATTNVGSDDAGVDVYYIGYENEQAAFNQGSGSETRHTFGARWFSDSGSWDWNFESFGQLGRFAGGDIRAWSLASDSGCTLRDLPLQPRFGLKANVISGDDDPDDRDLETFNPLFPKGKYFGEIGLLGPYNFVNLHPSVAFRLAETCTLEIGSACYWRQSQGDGVYDNGGNLLRGDSGSGARYVGTQLDVVLTVVQDRTLDVTLGWSTFLPGAFLENTGPAETVHFASAELRFRF